MRPDLSSFDHLPRFPDGRINFSGSDKAVGLMCILTHKGEALLLKRSMDVAVEKGKWHIVGGHVDEEKPIRDKILEEIQEETGVSEKDIVDLVLQEPYTHKGAREWLVYPARAEVKTKNIVLDWEHTDFQWINPKNLHDFDLGEGIAELFQILKVQ